MVAKMAPALCSTGRQPYTAPSALRSLQRRTFDLTKVGEWFSLRRVFYRGLDCRGGNMYNRL
jgi:hypothetical protein